MTSCPQVGWLTARAVAICENRLTAVARISSLWDRRCGHFGLPESVMMRGMRLLERLEELYAIGGGPGANRVGDSEGEQRGHEFAAAWMREAGFDVDLRIVPCRLGDRAGLIGAAIMAIEHVLAPDAVDRSMQTAA